MNGFKQGDFVQVQRHKTDADNGRPVPYWVNAIYVEDAAGFNHKVRFPNGVKETMHRDQQIRPMRIVPDEPTYVDMAADITMATFREAGFNDNEINEELADKFISQLDNWIETAAQNQRNTDYYRGLLVECGETIGDRAYIADDGIRHLDVLCAKIPEIIKTDYVDNIG